MIQRKIDSVGNVTGYFDTQAKKWLAASEVKGFDETTDDAGKVIPEDEAEQRVNAREEELAQDEEGELEEEEDEPAEPVEGEAE